MPSQEERFWAKIDKSSECWLWQGSKRHKGYGAFCYVRDGQVVQGRAHRYSYELHIGPIPQGMFVLHICDNPACVRPDHLFLGTNQDNIADMMRKGRHAVGHYHPKANGGLGMYRRGEAHHASKMTNTLVRQLRNDRAKGMSYSKLAQKYALSQGNVYRIANHITWRQVEGGIGNDE